MARLTFPDEGSRLLYDPATGFLLPVNTRVYLYLDSAATLPALDLLDAAGSPVTTGYVASDAYKRLPLFSGPDGVDTLYAVVSGTGPITPIYARDDDRLDALSTRVAAVEAAAPSTAVHTVNGHTGTTVTVTKGDVGLGNVDNTSDANKPVSTAQAAADAATLTSAQTYADGKVTALVNSAPAILDTLGEIATQLQSDESAATALATTVAGKLAKASNLSDVTDAGTSRANLHVPQLPAAQCCSTSNQTLSGLPTIDGYATQNSDLVLLTGQTTASQNGLWQLPASGTGAWSRPTSFPSGMQLRGRTCLVVAGTSRAATEWALLATALVTVDTTAQTWKQVSSGASVTTVLSRQPDKSASTQQVFDSLPEPAYGPALVVPEASVIAGSAGAAWYTANAATFMRFSLPRTRTYRYINAWCGTLSGNVQVGVCRVRPRSGDNTQIDLIRVADSGLVAMSGLTANAANRFDLGYFKLTPGEYVLFLWCDNTTATFLHSLATGVQASRLCFSNTGLTTGVGSAAFTSGVTTRWVSGLTLEAERLSVSLLGDSITANDNLDPSGIGSWFSRADRDTGYRFYIPTNNGAAGERTDQILTRAAAAFSGKRYATILGGTNDIGQNIATATITANLASIYAAAVSAGLTGFACCTIPPRMGVDTVTPMTTAQAATHKAVNAWIRSNFSSYAGAVLCDWTWALTDGTDESTPLLANFQDGIHPNATGSDLMAGVLTKAIRAWV